MESLHSLLRTHWDHEPLRLTEARSGPRVCDPQLARFMERTPRTLRAPCSLEPASGPLTPSLSPSEGGEGAQRAGEGELGRLLNRQREEVHGQRVAGRPGEEVCGEPAPVLRGKTLLYIRFGPDKSEAAVMDNLLSILNGDLSIWGVIAMPVGVAICFGPALFMWLKAELGTQRADKDEDRR